ncbi:hypothetical protein CY35_03G074600 [Sphagnum magellanicum]|nr:hypothetical protein CY35_03G074600 [Sphagnum magellanicum]KAH9568396.1 hypothetical protein CY35_03G074600 [Sphagnum magellanicum]
MASTLGPAPDPEAVLRGHRAAVNVVTFHSPSGTLLSGDADGELKIWDLRRHRPLSSSRVHTPAAGVIGISAAGASNKILSQGRDGTVKCWQLTESTLSRQPLLTIKTDSYNFCKLSLSESATMSSESEAIVGNTEIGSGAAVIAIAGKEPSIIEMWDIGSGKCVQKLPQEHLGPSTGMCMSLQMCPWLDKDGLWTLVAGYEDGTMMVWDIRHAAAPLIQARLHDEPVLSIAIDRIGAGGVSGSADGNLMFFFFDYQENTFVVKKKVEGQAGIGDIAIRGDDKLVATAGWDHRVRIYDYKRRKPLAILKYHTETVTGVTFREDMKWMATSSRDSTIALWSLYPPSSLQQNQQLVNSGGSS